MHPWHSPPPQSRSVSNPFSWPSLHVSGVGLSVGAGVGLSVGLPEGANEGTDEGDVVGAIVGSVNETESDDATK